ncbi:hypothetical protein ASG03_00070 [Rhizobium sp. Leaf341]|nr:hypothetical protein ASG03_00070 [Rhizobium sp. Leaf341]
MSGLVNLAFRGSTLVFRFLLSFYIIKYLGFEATGIYGLALGAIGILPAMLGWGLNYLVSREVIGKDPAFAAAIVKNRLFVTTATLIVSTILGLIVAYAMGYQITFLYGLIIALIWLETYGLDIHLPLIGQSMATEANLLVFVRSALWVPIVVGLGLAFPVFRTLEAVFIGWIASYVLAAALLAYLLRTWPLRQTAATPVDFRWIQERLRHSWHIYISDLSIVGLMYADRYIVNYMLTLTLTGVYTFFWSLTNALQTLMQTAVIQLALPILFQARHKGSIAEWKRVFRKQIIKTAVIATVLAAGVLGGSEFLIRFLSMSEISEHRGLFILLLLAAIVRSCSDLLNVGLTSLNKDSHYASINMFGVCLSVTMTAAMISWLGFNGTGVAALITAVVVTGIRGAYLLTFSRQADPLPADRSEPTPDR